MELFLKRVGLDGNSLRLAYLLGRDQGRRFVRGALIFPGIRIIDLQRTPNITDERKAKLIQKRDVMLEAMLHFIEEYADLSEDN